MVYRRNQTCSSVKKLIHRRREISEKVSNQLGTLPNYRKIVNENAKRLIQRKLETYT